MARGKYIKSVTVEAVKALDKVKPGIKTKVVADLLGVSDSTVQAIRRGEYDNLVKKATHQAIDYLYDAIELLEKDCR